MTLKVIMRSGPRGRLAVPRCPLHCAPLTARCTSCAAGKDVAVKVLKEEKRGMVSAVKGLKREIMVSCAGPHTACPCRHSSAHTLTERCMVLLCCGVLPAYPLYR